MELFKTDKGLQIPQTKRPPLKKVCELTSFIALERNHSDMPGPTVFARIRHTIGRALRETGQALDRVGVRGDTHAKSTKTLGDEPYKFNDHLSRHRNKMPLLKRGTPVVHDNVAYIAPCSSLIGTVHVGEGSSVWYGAVLRADRCNMGCGRTSEELEDWRRMGKEERLESDSDEFNSAGGGGIFIGNGTNIQDGCVITSNEDHTEIGNNVTVGHCAQIHSATVGNNALIGMGAVLNPGSKVESLGFVAAGAVVGKDQIVKSGELWIGNPAFKLRDLTDKEKQHLQYQAEEVSLVM